MRPRDLDPIRAAVNSALGQVGPGLYGVACSGGGDSLALAHATMAAAGPANVVVLTVDHGLVDRSADVAESVAAWARGLGAAGVVRRVTVPRRASVEAAAREARYTALGELSDELGLTAVFLGHTARDQAETVFMRILRGTGPAGLAAIPPRRLDVAHAPIIRPLLDVPRSAVDAYVATYGLRAWDDPMNHDPGLLRVRVRHHILPALRRENPQLDAALVRLAASTREWSEVIDGLAEPYARFPIDCERLANQPAAVRKRALALALDHEDIDFATAHLEAGDALVTRATAGQVRVDVPGAALVRSYAALELRRPDRPRDATLLTPPAGPFVLRTWRPGDRMRPARLEGRSKKLSDLFIDDKVPRELRSVARVLVRTTDDVIVWAEHVGLAHQVPEMFTPTVEILAT